MNRPLTDLHPGGFVGIPHALHHHPDTKPGHIAAYFAVVSCARWNGPEYVAEDARNRRLEERAGMKWHALKRYLRDLESWGFLRIEPRLGLSHRYVVLPTEDVSADVAADELEDRAHRPDVAGHRGGRPRKETPPANAVVGDIGVEVETPPAKPARDPRAISRPTPARYRETPKEALQETDLDSLCAEAHWRFEDATKAKSLAKAVGKAYAVAAIKEVNHRLHHPDAAGDVNDPWPLARVIAECYKSTDRCPDQSHGDLHGPAAMNYHRARQRDAADVDRAEEARRRAPADPDAEIRDFDAERERQKAELARIQSDLGRAAAL